MRILILGTGSMAAQHALNFGAIPGVTLAGGVDIDPERARLFCAEHGMERSFDSLESALDWGEFDAVANVTPDSVHYATTMAALAAGKHVYCEKPLATDSIRALEMADAAERRGLVNMVNFTFRNVPEIQHARDIVSSGQIGNMRHFEASYLQSWLVNKAWGDWRTESKWLWRLSKGHGSHGALGDVGVHILDYVTLGTGSDFSNISCKLQTYSKSPGDKIGDYTLDANDSFVMTATLKNGAIGVIHATRWATGHPNELRLRVYGDRGGVEVIHKLNEMSSLRVCLGEDVEGSIWKTVEAPAVETGYQRFVRAVRSGETLEPTFRHAAAIQRVIDVATMSDLQKAYMEVLGESGPRSRAPG